MNKKTSPKNHIQKLGFSLLELSVVLIIISVLMIAVIKGSDLVDQSRIAAAGQKTVNSPVLKIDGLTAWFETSLPSSFLASEIRNGGTISRWNNIGNLNPRVVNNAITDAALDANCSSLVPATAATCPRPTYTAGVINGLPVLRFDGTSDFFTYNGTALANSNYTIFVVEQRRSGATVESYFLAGTGGSANSNLHLGYKNNTTLTFAQFSNDGDLVVLGYSSPTPRIHSYTFSSSIGKTYHINGAPQAITFANQTTGLSSYNGAQIGRYETGSFYNGDIAEIIMFTRALSDQEILDVEAYLNDKYQIF